ncbi:hypothetical protein BGW36DRAFT_419333 [Talaromyces proteolyticus]|uniref:FAD-binding FR-type domain-containing protein n=1 Tax=Talaromyces proteolyticus TaxID=1131652 RepID=A0AAD4KGT8_9EURO|nr:uncharacterized protein BGW36DRAFT_419333 [Talaromyces proteolyticus]KAH8691849.1 hypothetical protein BGW36DRAFT_419333 [Talaromyces proteolyticus]
MEPLAGYIAAVIACFIVIISICFWNRHRLRPITDPILRLLQSTWKYLLYKDVIRQNNVLGPWTAAELLVSLAYIFVNVFSVLYPRVSLIRMCKQSGTVAFINTIFLYCSHNISFVADVLGVTPRVWRRLHRTVAWMVGVLTTIHMGSGLSQARAPSRTDLIGSFLAFSLIITILATSIHVLRNLTRNLASKLHWLLALIAIAAVYTHVVIKIGNYWMLYIIPICFSAAFLKDVCLFLYNNGIFGIRGWTYASFIRFADNTTRIDVFPGRPVQVHPGQYINLWVPFFGENFWPRFRQYHIQSCEPMPQKQMKLFDLPGGFLSKTPQIKTLRYIQENPPRLAFFTGPYGLSHTYVQYETILAVIYDYGILSVNALLQYIYQCMENRTSKVRRVRLVWQWETVSETFYDIREIKDLETQIIGELEKFSTRTGLDRTLIEYHLGRYVPPVRTGDSRETSKEESEMERLERETREYIVFDKDKDSEGTMAMKEARKHDFDRLQDKIAPLECRIDEYVARRRIMDDVFGWINNTALKRNSENFTLQCSVYRTDVKEAYKSGRAEIVGGAADLMSIFDYEITEHRRRIENDPSEIRGKFLVMVSAPPSVQARARKIVGANLGDVDLKEFQYHAGEMFN